MKKKLKNLKKKNFENFEIFFWIFSILKGPESGKEKNRKSGIRTFQNLPDFWTGRDVRLSPSKKHIIFWTKNCNSSHSVKQLNLQCRFRSKEIQFRGCNVHKSKNFFNSETCVSLIKRMVHKPLLRHHILNLFEPDHNGLK